MKNIVDIVIDVVSEYTGTREQILTNNRRSNVVASRIVAAKILKSLTCMGEHEIADALNRDYSSIHYYLKSFPSRYEYEPSFRNMYETCLKKAILETL